MVKFSGMEINKIVKNFIPVMLYLNYLQGNFFHLSTDYQTMNCSDIKLN